MRIGISTSVVQRGRTGVGQYVLALLRALVTEAPQHDYFVFVLEEDRPLFDFVMGRARLITVPEFFRAPALDIVWHQTRLPGLARRHKLDVLHIPSYRRLLWRRPCALVATIHDLAPFHLSNKYDWKRMFYGRVVVPRIARRQHRLIAISENTARDIEKFFPVSRARITVIHPAKNHVCLLAAFEEFKAATGSVWQLALAGSDWHGAENIHRAIRSSPCAADVRCLGFVADADLPNLYRAAEVFVYPSLHEGFGLPPLEAMACGTPVICSTRGALPEIVDEAAATVIADDYHSIAKQLYILASDVGEKNRLRAAGLAQAQKFDWRCTAQETVQVYQDVVHSLRRA